MPLIEISPERRKNYLYHCDGLPDGFLNGINIRIIIVMEKGSNNLTLEALNQAYLNFIKLFMKGTISPPISHINSLLSQQDPAGAFIILNQINF